MRHCAICAELANLGKIIDLKYTSLWTIFQLVDENEQYHKTTEHHFLVNGSCVFLKIVIEFIPHVVRVIGHSSNSSSL